MQDVLVVDLTRYLPGPLASRELLRLGARVVRLEPPEGDPLRSIAPAQDAVLNAGKESVACDLKAEPELGRALCGRADVVLEGFRPGVAARLGVGPGDVPGTVVYCSITGFGDEGRHAARAGHDLNYLGWAGALAPVAPALPPLPIADLAAGGLTAVTRILAALLERTRTGRGGHIVVSMTHGSHDLARFAGRLTGELACYRMYATAEGRWLTVGALEPHFWERLCASIDRPDLAGRQYDADQEAVARELGAVFSTRPLAEWLQRFEHEDVCVGPVATPAEAAPEFALPSPSAAPPALGEHTAAWRVELGLD